MAARTLNWTIIVSLWIGWVVLGCARQKYIEKFHKFSLNTNGLTWPWCLGKLLMELNHIMGNSSTYLSHEEAFSLRNTTHLSLGKTIPWGTQPHPHRIIQHIYLNQKHFPQGTQHHVLERTPPQTQSFPWRTQKPQGGNSTHLYKHVTQRTQAFPLEWVFLCPWQKW